MSTTTYTGTVAGDTPDVPRDEVSAQLPAFAWAFREAPTKNANEAAVLCWIARSTIDGGGYGAHLTVRQLGDRFGMSERTVRAVVGDLSRRRFIEPGDPRLVDYLQPGRRPSVWDVPFPGRGPRPAFVRSVPAWQSKQPTDAAVAARLSMWHGCWICGGPKEAVDHVKPRARGGPDMLCNYRPICTSCNSRKNDRWEGPRWAHDLAGSRRFGGLA